MPRKPKRTRQVVSVTLDPDVVRAFDEIIETYEVTRSQAIESLIGNFLVAVDATLPDEVEATDDA